MHYFLFFKFLSFMAHKFEFFFSCSNRSLLKTSLVFAVVGKPPWFYELNWKSLWGGERGSSAFCLSAYSYILLYFVAIFYFPPLNKIARNLLFSIQYLIKGSKIKCRFVYLFIGLNMEILGLPIQLKRELQISSVPIPEHP